MNWLINYSRDAEKFIKKEDLRTDVRNALIKFLKRMRGENINVDVKKLKGDWEGFYRIRKGKLRIIFYVDYNDKSVFIDKVDFRGNIYK